MIPPSIRAAAVGLALSVAMTVMFAGVVVATLGVVTETFARHRDGYLRAMRICGAIDLVALRSLLVLTVAGAL